jgi:C4-dicarboxylate-specific signal transduction histidine kinase
MNLPDSMNLMAGLMQFVVAGYALRLNRIFGSDRVGWSLFSAFSLLALLHLAQTMNLFTTGEQSATAMQAMYALISLLLLTGMAHIETLFNERLRLEQEEIRLRANLESEVAKKTSHLTRAIEALQAEIDERKRMEVEVEAHVELLSHTQMLKRQDLAADTEIISRIRF